MIGIQIIGAGSIFSDLSAITERHARLSDRARRHRDRAETLKLRNKTIFIICLSLNICFKPDSEVAAVELSQNARYGVNKTLRRTPIRDRSIKFRALFLRVEIRARRALAPYKSVRCLALKRSHDPANASVLGDAFGRRLLVNALKVRDALAQLI